MTNKTFYSSHSEITNPGEYQFLFDNLPDDISELCKVTQGIMVHIHWAEMCGVTVSEERRHEEDLRKVERQLSLITERTPRSNPIKLPIKQRIFGTCMGFSTILCSMLRHQRIPARPRCGFVTYFESLVKTDHWIYSSSRE
ncbi:MAG: transglutaminase domain-containing protein [Deltaproteobacteria bacterium]|nr:transglutaminase domain-containing protein [Deltaproteobacteria bacterium]MBW2364823.1 transglutaminase domain-containing protein [Deltaproteobacteria bacterium]